MTVLVEIIILLCCNTCLIILFAGFRYWKNPGPFVQFQGIGGSKGQGQSLSNTIVPVLMNHFNADNF